MQCTISLRIIHSAIFNFYSLVLHYSNTPSTQCVVEFSKPMIKCLLTYLEKIDLISFYNFHLVTVLLTIYNHQWRVNND